MTTATVLNHGRPTHHVRTSRPNNATPGLVRDWLVRLLTRAGYPDTADAAVVASELVTNAVLHARAPLSASAHIDHDTLTLTVTDRVALNPRPATATTPADEDWTDLLGTEHAALSEHGRGLDIVCGLCARFERTTDPNTGTHTATATINLDARSTT